MSDAAMNSVVRRALRLPLMFRQPERLPYNFSPATT